MTLRYSADTLLHLRNSPLCTRPDNLPPAEEWMGSAPPEQTRVQSKNLIDRPRNGDGSLTDQTSRWSGSERQTRNSANPDEIVFAPPRVNFSSRGKLLDGDKAAKELELGRFGIRSRDSENDRSRTTRGNPLRRRGDGEHEEGWSTVKLRKSFGAEGAERFSGKMGGNYRDEVKPTDRDANRDRQSKASDAFSRDRERDSEGRVRNGGGKKMEPWNATESSVDEPAQERRDRDRTKSWRDRDQGAPAENSRGDRRWGRDRDQRPDQRAERDPEWFDEPAKEQRDVHTQQDFQKWMEQMKKNKTAAQGGSQSVEATKPTVKSAPAIEQGPDKFFMAFGEGADMDSNTQMEQPDGAAKSKVAGKSSRFTSFFGGGQEERSQRTEPATPATGGPSAPPGFAHLLGGMGAAASRGGAAGAEDEKQAFQQLLAKLQKQGVSSTPPGLSPFSPPPPPPSQNHGDVSKKSAVGSPEPYQQYANERPDGPTTRPTPQDIHAPRPQQRNARPDQLLQELVGQHQRASSQGSSHRDPSAARNNSNAEFLMNLMRAGPPDAQRNEQLQKMMVRPGPPMQQPQHKSLSLSPMNERDAHAHQQQGRPGPPPGFSVMEESEPRPAATQILQRPPVPPGLDHMPPSWMPMHGPPPLAGVGPPPPLPSGQQRGGNGPAMMAPPGLPGGLGNNRNMPMPQHMFPPNFPPGAMPLHPDMARNMPPMPPPGFFNGPPPPPPPPPPHGYGPPHGMPVGLNGPPVPDMRAFGNLPFDARGMLPTAERGGNGVNYGRQ